MDKQKVLDAIIPNVKALLKSPGSAIFCSSDELIIIPQGGNNYKVSGWVDSQNSFGALLRSEFEYYVEELSDGRISIGRGGIGDSRPSVIDAKEEAERRKRKAEAEAANKATGCVVYVVAALAAAFIIGIIIYCLGHQ